MGVPALVLTAEELLYKMAFEKKDSKAIKFEVVLNNERSKSVERGKERTKEAGQGQEMMKFQETIQLCCLTMSSGPGTSFAKFKIPDGARCSVCGAGLRKKRG